MVTGDRGHVKKIAYEEDRLSAKPYSYYIIRDQSTKSDEHTTHTHTDKTGTGTGTRTGAGTLAGAETGTGTRMEGEGGEEETYLWYPSHQEISRAEDQIVPL